MAGEVRKVDTTAAQQRLPRVDTKFSLAWLLAPLSVETFLDEIWGATHHHIKRGSATYFDRLLGGPSAIDKLLESFRPEPSGLRLVRGGEKRGVETCRLADGSLDLARVRQDFADGFTVVFDGVERYIRTIALLSHSIEVELNFPIKINAYVTPPGSQGFVAHFDEHDVLVVQIQGSKLWHLYGVGISPKQMRRQQKVVTADLPSPTDLSLEVGDVLYLPRGLVHAAEATSETSVHLTVGIHAPTVLALLTRALYSLSFRDDRVHTQLPPRHLTDPDLRASANDVVRDVVRILEEEPSVIAEGLGELEDELVKHGRCPPVGQAISNAVEIDGQTLVVKYQPLLSRVTTVAGGVALQFAQLNVKAGPDHEAAMLFLSKSTEPLRVWQLPGLDPAQQIALARTLIVSGFLVRLPDD